jgi:hypothetical protein
MMTINNFDELLAFLKSEPLSTDQIDKIILESLRVNCYGVDEKEEIIRHLEEYWKLFGHLPIGKRPFFLLQKSLEFDISVFYGEAD